MKPQRSEDTSPQPKTYTSERLKRREIILAVYRGREFHGLPPLSHSCIRRYLIRPALRQAGVSLSPLRFTSVRFPRTFEEGIKLWSLQHGSVPRRKVDSIQDQIEHNREAMEQACRDQYRRSRISQLMWKMHPDPVNPQKRITLKALCQHYSKDLPEHLALGFYEKVKTLFLDGKLAEEAVKEVLDLGASMGQQVCGWNQRTTVATDNNESIGIRRFPIRMIYT